MASSKPTKKWSEYSESYRNRMKRHGITSRNYRTKASRAKMKEVRGHKTTPERPERAMRNPDKYPEYRERLSLKDPNKLERDAKARHDEFFAKRIGYHRERGPSMAGASQESMKLFAKMTIGEAESAVSLVGQAANLEVDTVVIDGEEYDIVDWRWLLYH